MGPPKQAPSPEREQQGGAAHDRGQDHRQEDQGSGERATGELGAGEHPGQRDPEDQGDARGGEGAGEAQAEGIGDHRPADEVAEVAPRRPLQERDERDGQEGDGGGGEGDHHDGGTGADLPPRRRAPRGHAGSKPYDVRISWPSSESTKATNAAATSLLPASVRAAIG